MEKVRKLMLMTFTVIENGLLRQRIRAISVFEVPAVEVMFAIHITQVQRQSVRPLQRCGPSPPMTCLMMMW